MLARESIARWGLMCYPSYLTMVLDYITGKGTAFRDLTSDRCAVFACASIRFREK